MKYKVFEFGDVVGEFIVEGDSMRMKLKPGFSSDAMAFLYDEEGNVSSQNIQIWLAERIFPPTRVDVSVMLGKLGLTEYSQIDILRAYKGRGDSDTLWIDFDNPF